MAPTPAATATPQANGRPTPSAPGYDLLELAARLRFKSATPLPPVPKKLTNYAVGRQESFVVLDVDKPGLMQVRATLRYVSQNAYFYVEDGVQQADDAIAKAAKEYEERIIPGIRRYINPTWDPGGGIDSRVTVLDARFSLKLNGYVNGLDVQPKEVSASSNLRPVVYLNASLLTPGTEPYAYALAHETQHLAHAQADPLEETWVQEGSSELFAGLLGYPTGYIDQFLKFPETQLTDWSISPNGVTAHYGGANLFVQYLADRYGADRVSLLVGDAGTGTAGVEHFLEKIGASGGFEAAFHDWTIANAVDLVGTRYGYSKPGLKVAVAHSIDASNAYTSHVPEYAAQYVQVTGSDVPLRLRFQGPTTNRILPTTAPSGRFFWWSNRGDKVDSTLTRTFDLTKATAATLRLKLWYDLEEVFDYAYVEVSADEGRSWDIVKGSQSSTKDPLGQAFGPGYTGRSGGGPSPRWVDEVIDLTPYAGKPIMLRFEQVTDEGISFSGFAVDDVAIPEIAFFDDAEQDGGWQSHGFVRTDNRVPQRFQVTFVSTGTASPAIVEMALGKDNSGSILLPRGQTGIIVVGAIAPATTETAPFTLTLEPAPPP